MLKLRENVTILEQMPMEIQRDVQRLRVLVRNPDQNKNQAFMLDASQRLQARISEYVCALLVKELDSFHKL